MDLPTATERGPQTRLREGENEGWRRGLLSMVGFRVVGKVIGRYWDMDLRGASRWLLSACADRQLSAKGSRSC